MLQIHTLLVGQPQTHTDARGQWRSAIFRTPVAGPIALGTRGLTDDRVADTKNHGSPDQAVCCHPLDHYAYWNEVYGLATPDAQLGPGSVGENWTIVGATEHEVCVGDIFTVGTARVQVSAPRYPCMKQERKVGLRDFLRRTKETRRTGWYLRVLEPGTVQAGDRLELVQRPNPTVTIELVNANMLGGFDPDVARQLQTVPELANAWKRMLDMKLGNEM